MMIGLGSIGYGLLAGVFSTLSPCVLPLLPLVLGGAVAAHRFGAAALTAGMVVSFVALGLFLATIGFAVGLDGDRIRMVSAALLAGFGVVLLSDALQQRFVLATAGMGNLGNRIMHRISPSGLGGQFIIGLVLGAVWSPCVGPTLGAASLLAAQGKSLGAVAVVMAAFGLGAALPLMVVGALSREVLLHWRSRMLQAGRTGKYLLGGGALVVGALILSGTDRMLETALVNASPPWLTDLTTRF
jgi:cytochrome c biogenesis protein CcdA